MRFQWFYIAISLFLITIVILQPHWMGALVLLYWLIRILILRDKKILLIIFSLIALLNIRVWMMSKESNLPIDHSQDVLFIKPTTYRVDGDRLSFEGYSVNYREDIIVQYIISSKKEKERLHRDLPQILEVSGELKQPPANRNIHQFNYQDYLKRKQIHYIFKANKLTSVNLHYKIPIGFKLDYFRARIITYLNHFFDGHVLSYIKALLFADMQSLELETLDLYKSLGIIHLISISGLHIDLIIKVVKKILMLFKVSRERAGLVLMVILPTYFLLTGLGVSVFRAVVSNTLKTLFQTFDIKLSKSDAWSITLILAILINPYVVYSIGFQLSYGISGLLIFSMRQSY